MIKLAQQKAPVLRFPVPALPAEPQGEVGRVGWSMFPSEPPQMEDLGSLFSIAVDAGAEQRSALLGSLAKNHREMAETLGDLLRSFEQFDSLFQQGRVKEPPWAAAETGEAAHPHSTENPSLPGWVGAYQIQARLGQGGNAQVYLARQAVPARKVALKVISADSGNPQMPLLFHRETQALALMHHPAIATLFEAGRTAKGNAWLAMEYVPGSHINDYCREQGLGRRQRLQLFRQMLKGVNHIHRQGVVHGDLKPSNVLGYSLDGEHMVKIIDFGLAHSPVQPSEEGARCTLGTPAYMAPELLTPGAGKGPTVSADIFALGMIFHELMVDRHPHDLKALGRRPYPEVLAYLRDTRPQVPAEMPVAMAKIFAKATAPNPEDRFDSAARFMDELNNHLEAMGDTEEIDS